MEVSRKGESARVGCSGWPAQSHPSLSLSRQPAPASGPAATRVGQLSALLAFHLCQGRRPGRRTVLARNLHVPRRARPQRPVPLHSAVGLPRRNMHCRALAKSRGNRRESSKRLQHRNRERGRAQEATREAPRRPTEYLSGGPSGRNAFRKPTQLVTGKRCPGADGMHRYVWMPLAETGHQRAEVPL